MTDEIDKQPQVYQAPNEHALINDLAIRCFRETGDGDYIAARMAMKAGLPVQFLWSALQAIEKYLKCILVLNRYEAKTAHDLQRALDTIHQHLPFTIKLTPDEQAVFSHIAESGENRYLIESLEVFDYELTHFDTLVWKLRQYCVPLDVTHYNDKPDQTVLMQNVARVEAALSGPAEGGHLEHGSLEKILDDSMSPAREGLIWRNAMFGGQQAMTAETHWGFKAINAPLWLRPELAQVAKQWVQIHRNDVKAFDALALTVQWKT